MSFFKKKASDRPEIIANIAYLSEVRNQCARWLYRHHTENYIALYSTALSIWNELKELGFGETRSLRDAHAKVVEKHLKTKFSVEDLKPFAKFRDSGAPLLDLGFPLREFVSVEYSETIGFNNPEETHQFMVAQYLFVSGGLCAAIAKDSQLQFWFEVPHQQELDLIIKYFERCKIDDRFAEEQFGKVMRPK